MSVYIFSLPKAGTYFFSSLLEKLGFHDTGFHISGSSYLDTKAHSLSVNAKTPGRAKVEKFFVPVIRSLGEKDVAAGHFPLPLNFKIAGRNSRYLCAYRDPMRTLVSEFIDFRFRREDVAWISKTEIVDDRVAFCAYLLRHGVKAHLNIFRNIALLRMIEQSPLCPDELRNTMYFVNFDHALIDPKVTAGIAAFLGVVLSEDDARARLQSALDAETKTKATGIAVDRDALWTDEARKIYEASEFPAIKALAVHHTLSF